MFFVHCALCNSYTIYRKLNQNSDASFSKYLRTLAEEWIACECEHNPLRNLRSTKWRSGNARNWRCQVQVVVTQLFRVFRSFSETRVNKGQDPLEKIPHGRHSTYRPRSYKRTIGQYLHPTNLSNFKKLINDPKCKNFYFNVPPTFKHICMY